MKVYRVVANSFTNPLSLDRHENYGLEEIYYTLGYTSFVGKRGYHTCNNLYQNIKEEGKYFYLFVDDAIERGKDIINALHKINAYNFVILEYDIPEELILKHIGAGNYSIGIMQTWASETYIQKSDLNGPVLKTSQISKEKKSEALVETLNNTLKALISFDDWGMLDIENYKEMFGVSSLDSVVDNKEFLLEFMQERNFYQWALYESGELVQCPYITGKVVPVSHQFIGYHREHEAAKEYLGQYGIDVDYSDEHQQFKKELVWYSLNKRDDEKIKQLLKEKKSN